MFGVHLVMPFEGQLGSGNSSLPEGCVEASLWLTEEEHLVPHGSLTLAFMCGHSGCRQAG